MPPIIHTRYFLFITITLSSPFHHPFLSFPSPPPFPLLSITTILSSALTVLLTSHLSLPFPSVLPSPSLSPSLFPPHQSLICHVTSLHFFIFSSLVTNKQMTYSTSQCDSELHSSLQLKAKKACSLQKLKSLPNSPPLNLQHLKLYVKALCTLKSAINPYSPLMLLQLTHLGMMNMMNTLQACSSGTGKGRNDKS